MTRYILQTVDEDTGEVRELVLKDRAERTWFEEFWLAKESMDNREGKEE